ncbi:hypothetical protein I6G56_21600 [Burkholderia humptydooensis]|uniref:Uncharacterized protein n=2 Tax=Burkholderia humptydooensis TaxID=430531 RepID=A0A7U4SVA6_9BURK|nr:MULTISPECIES: hypothetical protein [Burkholderia]AJY40257.1 hypothetical protein BW21_5772 [Burkholderia sp. 2002721687]ALX45587.1 hypothetical protein AQ610_24345 [Burkholderia humptydooensis]EIP86535.1 hypothetical protein A33K_16137 [Burkholderia humptydooensis MSMB43]QPS47070.1 hypothetical protein I6G56_21600 [Burkholderia humptydooensis]
MTDDITTPPPSSAARPLPSFGPLRWIVRHWRGGYSLADVALSLLNVWWIVGVWRAARQHIARTGRRFWARAAQMTVALVAARIVYSIVAIPHSIETLQFFVINPGSLFTDPVGTPRNWLF